MMQLRKPIKSPPPPNLPSSSTFTNNNNSKHFQKLKKYILISMAALLSLSLLSLLLFFTISSASHHHHHPQPSGENPPPDFVSEACKASREPLGCRSSLTDHDHVPSDATLSQVMRSALLVSTHNLHVGQGMVQKILDTSSGNQNRTNAAKIGLEVLGYSGYRMEMAGDALRRGNLKDARAWMSASLGYQYDCWSGLKYVNDTSFVGETMAYFNSSVIAATSNVLGMLVNYDVFGEETGSWGPPRTERDGFWEKSGSGNSGSGFSGGVPAGLKVDVTVCKGGCDYETVQKAVDAAPDNSGDRFVIRIKAGVYKETVRVGLEKRNVVFLGDGMGKTVITGSLNVGMQGVSTYNSATVGVLGDGFMASGLTIQNTAGPDAHQAVAFRSDSDLSIIENCEFIGNQDTLYAHSLRQYYKSCKIQGNVDFIFGSSASFFQDCHVLIAPRQLKPEKGENNAITAHGRIDPGQSTGFVFQNCLINGTDAYMALYHSKPKVHKNYLGRPWKEYSRTVFIKCVLEALVVGEGWMPWSGDFALRTLYYGEFENTGAGADRSTRVGWSSEIPADKAYTYSVENFIQGNQWIPNASS